VPWRAGSRAGSGVEVITLKGLNSQRKREREEREATREWESQKRVVRTGLREENWQCWSKSRTVWLVTGLLKFTQTPYYQS